jgi:integrase
MKLTKISVSKLRLDPEKTDQIFYDDELAGFGLRIRAGGSRKWIFDYRIGGVKRRHIIGSATAMDAEEARRKARKLRVQVDEGKDPAVEKATKKVASALLLASVAEDYLKAREKNMKPRSHQESSRHLRKHWKPLHNLSVSGVSRPVIAAHLRKIAEESGGVTADRARATLSAMYGWAIGEGLVESNPVIGTNKTHEDKPRERVLSDSELAAIWKAAPDNGYGRVVKLLMLTAQRREEIGGLRWSEIKDGDDAKKARIELPSDRTKNSRPHDVPLSTVALKVLDGHPSIEDRDLVFGDGEGGYSGWSRSKERLDTVCKVKDWTLHDLRRTAATRMADLGVQPHIIEVVLNHVSGHKAGVAGIYNRSTYASEKRDALDRWASHLRVVLAQADGAKVTRLRSATA